MTSSRVPSRSGLPLKTGGLNGAPGGGMSIASAAPPEAAAFNGPIRPSMAALS